MVDSILADEINRIDRDLTREETYEIKLFESEFPYYEEWTRQLNRRFEDYEVWSRSCYPRLNQTECEFKSSQTRPRIQATGVRCNWKTFWIATSICAPDESQWRDTATRIIQVANDLQQPRRIQQSTFPYPLLPFIGFIGDIVFQVTEGQVSIPNL
ncbi:MAG: hypothetical protein Sylvanvirus15_2, partial [Sylvanvirus sp.]